MDYQAAAVLLHVEPQTLAVHGTPFNASVIVAVAAWQDLVPARQQKKQVLGIACEPPLLWVSH